MLYDGQMANKITETAKQIIKEQEKFMIALCNPGEEILEFVHSYDVKYPILQEVSQHKQKGWYRKFEKRKW